MKNTEQVLSFIMYNYTPFQKKQCIKRLLIIWGTSLILVFVGGPTTTWVLILGIIDVLLSVVLLSLVVRYSQSQVSRYLCDGFFWLYISIFFNLTAYRITTLQKGPNGILALILIVSLIACIFLSILLTLSNIRSGKFSKPDCSKKILSLPTFCGAIAIFTAKLSLQGATQQEALTVFTHILLLLSFIMSVPSINLLKAILYKRYFYK